MSKKRCYYCWKSINTSKDFCSDRCKDEYNSFEKYVAKNMKFFITGIVSFLILAFVGMIISAYYAQIGVGIMSISGIGLFIIMLIFPFTTPETVQLMGVKKSVIAVRVLVVIVIIAMGITTFL